jgi:hypothetical protein
MAVPRPGRVVPATARTLSGLGAAARAAARADGHIFAAAREALAHLRRPS